MRYHQYDRKPAQRIYALNTFFLIFHAIILPELPALSNHRLCENKHFAK